MAFLFAGLFSRSRRRRKTARTRLAWTAATLLSLGAMAMAATAYSRLYVFGESLTETANLLAATGIGAPPASSGNFDGNDAGALAYIEDLAAHLGLQANPSNSGGTNYAFGGALNDIDGVLPEGFQLPSLAAQINNYLTANGGQADPNGLYVVQGGTGAGDAAGQLGAAGAPAVTFGAAQNFTTQPFENSPPIILAGLPTGSGDAPCVGEACNPPCVGEACNPPPQCQGPTPCGPITELQPECPPNGPPCVTGPPGPGPGGSQVCEHGGPPPCIIITFCQAGDTTPECMPLPVVCAHGGPPPCITITFCEPGSTAPECLVFLPTQTADVPEPATILVIIFALGTLLWMRGLPVALRVRRRREE